MKYTGGCHCGQVRFEADGEVRSALACNCSICSKKASLLWFVPRSAFRLLTPESAAVTYTFNKQVIQHRFCRHCVQPFAYGVDPKGNEMAAVNLRCLEGIDLAAIPVKSFDGRSL